MKATIVSVAMVLAPLHAQAGQAVICMTQAEMEAALIDWYQAERDPVSPAEGLGYWRAPETGTWALVQILKDGRACVLGSGTGPINEGMGAAISSPVPSGMA